MGKKVAFKTIGCRLNQYETDSISTDFYKAGYKIVGFNDKADVYIINTCTVTNQSDHKSKNYIQQVIKHSNKPVLVVTGCMANNRKDELENKDGVTYVIENINKNNIFTIIDAHFKGELIQLKELNNNHFDYSIAEHSFHTRSMIKVQDGCNNVCSYCIVPKVRGKAISRSLHNILDSINKIIELGYKEVVLTGVNISRYSDKGINFEDLLEKILEIKGDFRVRISSIEPEGFGDKFIHLFQHPKLCPHLHLCLQSGSDNILRQMRRQYTTKQFLTITENLKNHYPYFNLTTDIIVGFPGETEEDFVQSCRIIKQIGFSHVHTFKYSVRENTKAARLPEQIDEKIKKERSSIIRALSEENKLNYRRSLIGKKQTVLVEKIIMGVAKGYGEHYVPVELEGNGIKRNSFITTCLIDLKLSKEPTLIGDYLIS